MDEGGSTSRYVPIHAAGGDFRVEVVALDEDEEVSARSFEFEAFNQSLRAVSEAVTDSVVTGLNKLKPSKVTVEFGCEVGMETGKLTAILLKGTAKANLKVTVEWTPGTSH